MLKLLKQKVKYLALVVQLLTTTAALTAVENKIPNVCNLVRNTDYNTKINEIEKKITDHSHDKYISTPEFNKPTAENFAARLAQANQSIFVVKVILKIMVLKIIQYFRQHMDILKGFVILMIIFYHENQKDCLMKSLRLLLHLIIFLIFY